MNAELITEQAHDEIHLPPCSRIDTEHQASVAKVAAKPKGNPVNDLPGITKLLQTNDGQDTPSAKPTNDKNEDSNCHLRSTCKMPEAYCKTGRCADWFF